MTIGMPDWALEIPSAPVHNSPDQGNAWSLPFTQAQLQQIAAEFIEQFLRRVVQAVVGTFIPGAGPAFDQLFSFFSEFFSAFDGIDLSNPGAILGAIADAIADALSDIPVVGEIAELIANLINGGQPINASNLFGSLLPGLFSSIPIGVLSNDTGPTMFVAGSFPDADSIKGNGTGWSWDPAVSRTSDGTGSARVVANGSYQALRGAEIAVAQGQTFQPSVFVRWDGYSGTAAPVQLHLVKFAGATQVGIEVLDTHSPPGSDGGWAELTGAYPVEPGVTTVKPRLVLTPGAAAGVLHWDDGGYEVSSHFVSNLGSWFDLVGLGALFTDPGSFDPAALIPVPFRSLLNTVLEALQDFIPDLPFDELLDAIRDGLLNIPFGNVIGVGGPDNVGSSILETWNQFVGGLVGAVGSGAGLADLFNVGQEVSSRATRGSWALDVLGIRSNKALRTGFLPSSQSNLDLMLIAAGSMSSVPITQSTALTGYERVSEAIDIGAVAFQQVGNVSNVTHCFISLYKMNTATGVNDLLHESANIVGLLGVANEQIIYELPSDPVHFEPTELLGMEIAIRGAGTLNVGGEVSGLPDQKVYPRRWSSVRNSGTSPAPSSFTPTYGNNVPFIEFAVSAGDVDIPHSPQIVTFNTAGTFSIPIPDWCNIVDRIVLPGGGGGHVGGTWGIGGQGGDHGDWAADSLVRGTHFSGTPSLTTVVGASGAGGSSGDGANGGASTSSISGGNILTTPGGIGATDYGAGGSEYRIGHGPGTYTFPGAGPEWTVTGGGDQHTYGANGSPPGGAGAGGNWVSFQPGGNGAPGVIFYRFRQD